jgi:hypothetical protein
MPRLAAIVAALVLVGAIGAAPVTLARFTATRTANASFTVTTLQPPTSLVGTNGTTAGLAWTASTSAAATGYQVLRSATSGSGYTQVKTVTPVSATSTTDNPANGTWYYVLRTYAGTWTSGNSNEAPVIVGSSTNTGFKGCTSNGADTGGDNNGYESSPGNACTADAAVATDANSGTNGTLSCIDAGKDRHRFWGYAFGLPGTVTVVNGISLQLIASASNGGTVRACAQLSWDGGTTWTATQQVGLTSTLTTYTLGSASDTWGHTWTAAQLGTSLFRVRVIDVSSNNNRDFRLDYIGAGVTYMP